jgi:hypothetical protein
MMTCHDCGANLHAVPVGDPCPDCGSTRRDAAVSPPTVEAIVTVPPPTIVVRTASVSGGGTIEARGVVLPSRAQRRLEELAVGSLVRTVVFHDPGEDGVVLCEARDEEGKLLDAKPGKDAADALLAVAEALLPTGDQ